MAYMFQDATSFNQALSAWNADVSSVRYVMSMFRNATAYAQNLSGWDVSNTELVAAEAATEPGGFTWAQVRFGEGSKMTPAQMPNFHP